MTDTNHPNGQSLNPTSRFMIGLACGAAIGAAVGVLLATKSGAELRGQIADSARRFGKRSGPATANSLGEE